MTFPSMGWPGWPFANFLAIVFLTVLFIMGLWLWARMMRATIKTSVATQATIESARDLLRVARNKAELAKELMEETRSIVGIIHEEAASLLDTIPDDADRQRALERIKRHKANHGEV